MKITVITVCYNVEKKIECTLRSVLAQKTEDLEYIVIDGNSTDGTMNILNRYMDDKRISIFSERDFGVYNAMNRGIARASGDYVIFMNAGDVFYDENVLSNIFPYLIKGEKTIFYGKIYRVNYTRNIDRIKDFSKIASSPLQGFMKREMPCHQGIIAPIASLRNFYFNEKYKYAADFDWLIRCYKAGYKLKDTQCMICYYDNAGLTCGTVNRKRMRMEYETILKNYFPMLFSLEKIVKYFGA